MFQFKFEPLLRHRRHLEEDCRKRLADLQTTLLRQENKLGELFAQKDLQEKAVRDSQQGKTDVSAILAGMAYLQRLERKVATQQKVVSRARKACERQRAELMDAMKGRKIIEKLKEKGNTAYRAEEARIHQNLMNEIAINRFSRDR